MGHRRRRQFQHRGLRHRHQRQSRQDRSTSRSTPNSSNYRIDIYRLGYYGGMGARKVATIQHTGVQNQPTPLRDSATGLVDAGNWAVSASWAIPADAVSGIYIAKLVRQDGTAGENHIPFIVRDDSSHSDIVFQTSDETWQAYNPWGGANLYRRQRPGRRLRARARLRGQLQPSDHHPGRRPRGRARRITSSASSTRPSSGWRRTATTSPTWPAWIPTASAA